MKFFKLWRDSFKRSNDHLSAPTTTIVEGFHGCHGLSCAPVEADYTIGGNTIIGKAEAAGSGKGERA